MTEKPKTVFNEDYIQTRMKESGLSHAEVKELLKTTLYELESDFTSDADKYSKDKTRTKWNLTSALAKAYHAWQTLLKAGNRETEEGQEAIDRAAKVYWDLKSYITEDFTSDIDVIYDVDGNVKKSYFVVYDKQGNKYEKSYNYDELWNKIPDLKKKYKKEWLGIGKVGNPLGDFTNGSPKKDGSGKGTRANKGRGGCSPADQQKKDDLIKGWMIDDEISEEEAEERYEKSFSAADFTDDANFPVTDKLYLLLSQVLNILDRQMNRLEKELSKMTDTQRDRLYNHPFIKEFRIDMLP